MSSKGQNHRKLTIITVNKNNGHGLRRTLQSVSKHVDKTSIEYVVIDACSLDDSIEIAKEFQDIIDIFISEDDTGPYDAMNKGLNYASGQFVYFLNSGDKIQFWDNAIFDILQEQTIYYFHVVTPDRLRNNREKVSLMSLGKKTLNHQGVIYHRELLLSVGGFRTEYRIISDFISMWKIKASKRKFVYLSDKYAVARYQGGGLSSQSDISMHEKETFFKEIIYLREGKPRRLYPILVAILFFLKRGRNRLKRGFYRCVSSSGSVAHD